MIVYNILNKCLCSKHNQFHRLAPLTEYQDVTETFLHWMKNWANWLFYWNIFTQYNNHNCLLKWANVPSNYKSY